MASLREKVEAELEQMDRALRDVDREPSASSRRREEGASAGNH